MKDLEKDISAPPKNLKRQISNGNSESMKTDDNENIEREEEDYKNMISSLGDYSHYLSITHDASLSDDDEYKSFEFEDEQSYDNLSSPTFEKGSMGSVHSASSGIDEDTPACQDPVEKEKMMLELKEELIKVEGEISTLRQVLGTKVRHATELKRRMGITPFQEFKADMQTSIEQIRGSDSYQKTSGMVKTATEKTSSAFSAVGGAMSKKLGDIKNSPTFKSLEEKVEHTYTNVKAKVTGSKSNQELGEELREEGGEGDDIPLTTSKSTPLPEEKVPLN